MGVPFLKDLRNLVFGLVLGLALGLWFGVNLGKGKPVLSNPFANPTIQNRIKQTGSKVLDQSGKALEESGKALRKAVNE